jgi:hypothetical protein
MPHRDANAPKHWHMCEFVNKKQARSAIHKAIQGWTVVSQCQTAVKPHSVLNLHAVPWCCTTGIAE